MSVNSPLIVTGMHRSGTSLLTQYLHIAGVDMGSEMLPGDVGNPHGYYEDAAFQALHRDMLRRAGITDGFTITPDDVPIAADATFKERAAALLDSRAGKQQWGWKDPRTVLFLDAWNELTPQAGVLVLYRDPLAVLDSLMRRATNPSVNERPATALVLWTVYNSEALRFYREHGDRCLFYEADAALSEPHTFLARVRERFGLQLNDAPLEGIFRPGSYHRKVRSRARVVAMTNRAESSQARELYATLQSLN